MFVAEQEEVISPLRPFSLPACLRALAASLFWLKLGRPATAFVHQRDHAVTIVSRRPLLEMHPSRLLPTAAADKYTVLGKACRRLAIEFASVSLSLQSCRKITLGR